MENAGKRRGKKSANKKAPAKTLVNSNEAGQSTPPPLLENSCNTLGNETSNLANMTQEFPEAPELYMVGHTPRVINQRSERKNSTLGRLDRSQLQEDNVISPMIRKTRNTTRNVTLSSKTPVKGKPRKLKLQTKLATVGSLSTKTTSNISDAENTNDTVGGGKPLLTINVAPNSDVVTLKTAETSCQQPMELDSEDTQFDEQQLLETSQTAEESPNKDSLNWTASDTLSLTLTAEDTDGSNLDANDSQEVESATVLPNEKKRKIVGDNNEKGEGNSTEVHSDSNDDTITWEYSTPPPCCSSNGRSILRRDSTKDKQTNDDSSIPQPNLTSKATSNVAFIGGHHKRFFDSKRNKLKTKKLRALPLQRRTTSRSNPILKKRAAEANTQILPAESQLASGLGFDPSPNTKEGLKPAVTNFSGEELNKQVFLFNGDSNGFDTTGLSSLENRIPSSDVDSPLLFSQLSDPAESQIGIGTDYNKAIFPALQTCQDLISAILEGLTCNPKQLQSVFSSLNIKTVGDLCGRTKAEIKQFPIRSPKEYTLNLVLEKYLKNIKANRMKLITAPMKLHLDTQNIQQSQLSPKRSKTDKIKLLNHQSRISKTSEAPSNSNGQIHKVFEGNAAVIDSQVLNNSNPSSIVHVGTDPSLNDSPMTQSKNYTEAMLTGAIPPIQERTVSNHYPKEYESQEEHKRTNTSTLDFGNLEVIDQLQKFIQGKHGDAFLNQLFSDVTVAEKVQAGMINRWHDADEKFLTAKQNQNSALKNIAEKSINGLYQDFANRNDPSTLSSEFWNRQLLILFTGYKSWTYENANDKSDIQLWMKIVDILKKQHPSYFLECPSDDSSMADCVKYMIKSFAKFPETALISEEDILVLLPDLLKRMSPEAQSRFYISRMKFF